MKEGNFEYKTSEKMEEQENYKREIIPEEWKADIDEIIARELHGANRAFAQLNEKVVHGIDIESKKQPDSFYRDLIERWGWHDVFYENLLEPAVGLIIEKKHTELAPLQVEAISECYKTASLVDQATLIVSAASKKNVENWIDGEGATLMSPEERQLLLTIPHESFWIQYHVDHLDYILAKKGKSPNLETIEKNLLEKYHANDELIFSGRMKKFKEYDEMDQEAIERVKESMLMDDDHKIRHRYLTLERPRLKSIRDILEFDNIEEYAILKKLVGISGFVLRKKVLEYLSDAKILKKANSIYEFPDQVIIDGLTKLLGYRNELLIKNVVPFRQSTRETCSVACFMMAMHYFKKMDLYHEIEKAEYDKFKSNIIPGSHLSGIAAEAGKAGLESVLMHTEPDLFKNEGMFNSEVFSRLMEEYRAHLTEAERWGTQVLSDVTITTDTIKQYLQNNYLVLVSGKLGQSSLHTILATGYNAEGLIVCDPLKGNSKVERKEYIDYFMKTPIGSWVLAIRKDNSNLSKLLEKLSDFNAKATSYLNE